MSGDESDQPPTEPETPPSDSFALVGHEIRAEIIQVLGVRGEQTLSELRTQMDTEVAPSQLHYHLQQLVGHFVEKVDDGYELNSVGTRLSWLHRAGSLERRQEHVSVAAGFECYYCQTPVEATFDNGCATLECPECEYLYMTDYYVLPLEAFEDESAAFSYFSEYTVLRILSLGRGICPGCGNPLTTSFTSSKESSLQVELDHSCASCGATWWQSVGMACLADPELIAFCYNHGVDVLSTPHWELEFAMTDDHVTVRSTDPWKVALEVTFGGDTLELVVDGDLNVIERNREDVPKDGTSELLRGIQIGYGLFNRRSNGDEPVLPDNAACLQTLRRHRWKDGVTCPNCESEDTIKKGATNNNTKQYLCHNCESIFNDLTGTLFAEHRLSLSEMFYIIGEMEEKDPTELAGQIDRSYQSILNFVQKIEQALLKQSSENPS